MQDNLSIQQKFKVLKCCVLLPTYNNSKSLETVIQDVLQYTDDVCLINDGSTDNTAEILAKFPQLKILSYQPNQGKGWALRQGFLFAAKQSYHYAISMDTDGQHYAEDLPVLLHALEHNPNAIVIGARNMNQEHIPGKSNFGRKFSNFWFRFETGIDAPDTQSGYRLYPLKQLNAIRFFTKKFEFEVEVIVRGVWSGLDVLSVPVKVYYPPANERVSHFRPLRDFSRISVLNTCLVTWLFIWIWPRNLFRWIQKKNLRQFITDAILKSGEPPSLKAMSVAVGVFFGLSPLWGFHTLLGIGAAILFRLNKPITIIAANISLPPLIPFIIFFGHEFGALMLGKNAIHLSLKNEISLQTIAASYFQYFIGSFALAAIVATLLGLITYSLLMWRKR